MTESKTSFSRYWIISRYLSLPIFKFIYFELRKVLRRKESSWYHVGKTESRDMEKESHIDLIVPIIKWATFWIVSIGSHPAGYGTNFVRASVNGQSKVIFRRWIWLYFHMHAKNLSLFLNGLSNKKEPRLISSQTPWESVA